MSPTPSSQNEASPQERAIIALPTSSNDHNCLLNCIIPHLVERDELANCEAFRIKFSQYYHFEHTLSASQINQYFKQYFPSRMDQEIILGQVMRQFLADCMEQARAEFLSQTNNSAITKHSFQYRDNGRIVYKNWLTYDSYWCDNPIKVVVDGYIQNCKDDPHTPRTLYDYIQNNIRQPRPLDCDDIKILTYNFDVEFLFPMENSIQLHQISDKAILIQYNGINHFSFVPDTDKSAQDYDKPSKLAHIPYHHKHLIQACLHNPQHCHPINDETIQNTIASVEQHWRYAVLQTQQAIESSIQTFFEKKKNKFRPLQMSWPFRIRSWADLRRDYHLEPAFAFLDHFNYIFAKCTNPNIARLLLYFEQYIANLQDLDDDDVYQALKNNLPEEIALADDDKIIDHIDLPTSPFINIRHLAHSDCPTKPLYLNTQIAQYIFLSLPVSIEPNIISKQLESFRLEDSTLQSLTQQCYQALNKPQTKLMFVEKFKRKRPRTPITPRTIESDWQKFCNDVTQQLAQQIKHKVTYEPLESASVAHTHQFHAHPPFSPIEHSKYDQHAKAQAYNGNTASPG